MKIFLIVFLSGFLFSQATIDTTGRLLKFNQLKGLNIPGLIPSNISIGKKNQLLPNEIIEIKQKAKAFIPESVTNDDIVVMETNRGNIKLKLFPDIAPNHCQNFKKLANSTFYDGTTFHRIIPGFMIQGGDINSRDNNPLNDGQGGPGWTVDAEFNEISHKRGVLSMARSGDPHSAGSQFFICVADAPHLDGKYTAFGKVVENLHVVDTIVQTPTDYIQAKRMSKQRIPDGEDPDNWITLRDPKTGQKLYSKVPQYMKKVDYEYDMRNKIKSDQPTHQLVINKIRILPQSENQESKTE